MNKFLSLLLLVVFCCASTFSLAKQEEKREYDSCLRTYPSGRIWSPYVVNNRSEFENSAAPLFLLSSWFERFGNNFMQVKQALKYAICCSGRLEIQKKNKHMPYLHQYLDFSVKTAYTNKDDYTPPKNCSTGINHTFFYIPSVMSLPKCQYDEYSALQYFMFGNDMPYGCISRNVRCANDLDRTLVVHLRSGDIFSDKPKTAIHLYRQPPVEYYRTIFQSRKWKKIILVTSIEETSNYNPVWTYFQNVRNIRAAIGNNYTVFKFQMSSSLDEDMRTLWCARYFVASSSTLSNMILQTGPFLREVFAAEKSLFVRCSNYERFSRHGIKCHQISLPGYNISSFIWNNSKIQREEMISYRISPNTN